MRAQLARAYIAEQEVSDQAHVLNEVDRAGPILV